MKKILVFSFIVANLLHAEGEIVIAPPPVSYSALQTVGSESGVGLNYISYSADSFDMTGYGVGFSHRIRNDESSLHYISAGYMNLTASNDMEMDIYNVNYLYGHNLSKELIGFVGANINYSSSSLEVPYGSTTGSDIYIDTMMYGVNAGFQYDVAVSFGSVIPWVFASYISGSSETEMIQYGTNPLTGNPYPTNTSSADIDPILAYQFGLDMFFKAINTSLSSMYQSSDSGDMLSLSLNYNF
ncbi:hypothetical protein KJ877_04075 [bacterium]|nr:hypothetical protein [bacterium]MBU1989123.1 hypothetical protein [bacterium]